LRLQVFWARGGGLSKTEATAREAANSFSVATIYFGEGENSEEMTSKNITDYATLTNFSSTNISNLKLTNAHRHVNTNYWKDDAAVRLGDYIWQGKQSEGKLHISFKNFQYKSIIVTVKSQCEDNIIINNHYYTINENYNEVHYRMDTCSSQSDALIITTGTGGNQTVTFISKIELHY
jgi:hypothetical protein